LSTVQCQGPLCAPGAAGGGAGDAPVQGRADGGPRSAHRAVLSVEVVRLAEACVAALSRPLHVVDCTVGAGGHARAVLAALPAGSRLLGLDLDPAALELAEQTLSDLPADRACRLVRANFRDLAEVARREAMVPADFVLFDTGVSSMQLDQPERGFSFRQDGPLDMRYGPDVVRTAADLLDSLSERALADVLYRFGEERAARRIARRIVTGRPWSGTQALAEAIAETLGRPRIGRVHPATRSFQAIRSVVNEEMASLQRGLAGAASILGAGGLLVVIAFESLSDRLVKNFVRSTSRHCICPVGTPECRCRFEPVFEPRGWDLVRPAAAEVARNPRSRSARLRAARRTAAPWRAEAVEWGIGAGVGNGRGGFGR